MISVDDATASSFQSFAENLSHIADHLFSALQLRHPPDTMAQLVDLLVPQAPVPPHALKLAAMTAQAKSAVLKSGDWLTANNVAKLAGQGVRNPAELPSRWLKQGKIFAIHHRGTDYFPVYGLDPDTGYRPRKAIASVIALLKDGRDGWDMAYWFESINSFLGGKTPKSLLRSKPEKVIAAAKDYAAGITHG
ncbi:MAG: hypothetical protein SF172_04200 [Burkholderiales bacterium]|nr:hypothetical protein [Burkholderiales bacterium]